MGADGVYALVVDVLPILFRQFESGPKFGILEGGEGCGDLVCHAIGHDHNHIRLTSRYASQGDGGNSMIDETPLDKNLLCFGLTGKISGADDWRQVGKIWEKGNRFFVTIAKSVNVQMISFS